MKAKNRKKKLERCVQDYTNMINSRLAQAKSTAGYKCPGSLKK